MTPLFNAMVNGHSECAKLLLDRGADKDAKTQARGFALPSTKHARALLIPLCLGPPLCCAFQNGITPLLNAIFNGRLECVRLLLDRGADKEAAGQVRSFSSLDRESACTERAVLGTVRAGCMQDGNTPLLRAQWLGHLDCAKLLLDRGANNNVRCRIRRARRQ